MPARVWTKSDIKNDLSYPTLKDICAMLFAQHIIVFMIELCYLFI